MASWQLLIGPYPATGDYSQYVTDFRDLSFNFSLRQRGSTCRIPLDIWNKAIARPRAFNEVRVLYPDGTTLFGGVIMIVTQQATGNPLLMHYELDCVDYTRWLDHVPAGSASYPDGSIKGDVTIEHLDDAIREIIRDWATNPLSPSFGHRGPGAPITTSSVQAFSLNYPGYDPNYISVSAAIDFLCKQFNIVWFLDQDRDLHTYLPDGTNPATGTLIAPLAPIPMNTSSVTWHDQDPIQPTTRTAAAGIMPTWDYDNDPVRSTGTATAGGSTTLTDSGAAWTVNQWAGGTITITSGTGAGQSKPIASNTATVITVATPWPIQPNATSRYELVLYPGHDLEIVEDGSNTLSGVHVRDYSALSTTKMAQALGTGDGIKTFFPLNHQPADPAHTTATVGGATYSVSNPRGSKSMLTEYVDGQPTDPSPGDDCYVCTTNNGIRFGVPPPAGQAVTATYNYYYPDAQAGPSSALAQIIAAREGFGPGYYYYVIANQTFTAPITINEGIPPSEAAMELALKRFARIPIAANFTSRLPKWRVGQVFYIKSPNRGDTADSELYGSPAYPFTGWGATFGQRFFVTDLTIRITGEATVSCEVRAMNTLWGN